MSKKLLPAQAMKKWITSTVAEPCKVALKICERHPSLSNKELVAKCVAAGVSKKTASVRVSRFKSALKKVR